MAANVVSKANVYSGDQAGAFVDTVTFTNLGDNLTVDNRSATVHISLTKSNTATAATPTYLGDDCYYIPAGAYRVFPGPCRQVKLIGSAVAMSYTVAVI